MAGSHIVAVDSKGYPFNGRVFGIRHVNIDDGGEGVGTGCITILGILCSSR